MLRRGKDSTRGYLLVWWKGDHPPRHVHVYNNDGKLLGRIVLWTMAPLDDWSPPRRVVKILEELQKEGRL